tara:strand:+ start:89 stop:328 length:240 start_codon:yes stop_codon:yes gene_type:complete
MTEKKDGKPQPPINPDFESVGEQFSYWDQKTGKQIILSSGVFPINQLCLMASEFLGITIPEIQEFKKITTKTTTPDYTG